MTPIAAFRDLLLSLASVFATENRAGADELVQALRNGARTARPATCTPFSMNEVILAASTGAAHPAARSARAAHSLLPWSRTGILDDQIDEDISSIFAVAALVGPGTLIESERVRGGLFVQCAEAFYPAHAHAAEETYAMLAGNADWQCDFGAFKRRAAGDLIHHSSNAPHATRTARHPILAAWRWSGDIGCDSYRMIDQPGH